MTFEELSQALSGMDPLEAALGGGFIVIILVLMGILALAWYFISAIGYCKMFKKAGEAGWKAFIPYYSTFIRFKISWNTKTFWLFLVCLLVAQWFSGSDAIVLSLLATVLGIVMIILGLKLDFRMAKAYGKSKGWGLLLFFFPFIASLILGFGKAAYVGNQTAAAAE